MEEKVVSYKCKNCGGDLLFDPESSKLICGSCSQTYEISELEETDFEELKEKEAVVNAQEYSESEINEFNCKNCGAVLVTDKYTTSTICNFCNSPMIINERFTKSIAPALVIPFTYDNESAKSKFKKWCKKGLLTPKDFNYKNKVSTLEGIYIPFWLYDLDCDTQAEAICTRRRIYSTASHTVTETYYYLAQRRIASQFKKIPADASVKMDDATMDLLEPFDYNGLKKFDTKYLSGFSSEQFSFKQEELLNRIKNRANVFIRDFTKSTLNHYSTVSINSLKSNIQPEEVNYALLPVYVVSYKYKDKEYTFAMNGQTGKVVGKAPISKGKLAILFLSIFLVIVLIAELIYLVVK